MYELFVTIGGKIITWILPYLIKKADKYVPIFLDDLINMILNKREEKVESADSTKGSDNMSTVKITVETETGVLIEGATVLTKIGGTSVDYTTDTNGIIEKSGFTSGESYTFTAVKTGYITNTVVVVASDDGVVAGVIKMVVIETASTANTRQTATNEAVNTVATAIETAQTSTTTVSEDWKTIKATAESAIKGLSTSLITADLTNSDVLQSLYSQVTTVINNSITKVNAYESQLMISRHPKNGWECALIDIKLFGIEIFKGIIANEISVLKAKITDKISSLTK